MFDCSKCVPNKFYNTIGGYRVEYVGKRECRNDVYFYFFHVTGNPPEELTSYIENGKLTEDMDTPIDIVGEWQNKFKVGDKVTSGNNKIGEVLQADQSGDYPVAVLWTTKNGRKYACIHAESELTLID
jgi:hypothetical protein